MIKQFALRVPALTSVKLHWNDMGIHLNDLSAVPSFTIVGCPKGSCTFAAMQRKLRWQPPVSQPLQLLSSLSTQGGRYYLCKLSWLQITVGWAMYSLEFWSQILPMQRATKFHSPIKSRACIQDGYLVWTPRSDYNTYKEKYSYSQLTRWRNYLSIRTTCFGL
jgi:hypothetical protein